MVEFGNYDAFIAVYGVWALDCLSQLYTALGDGTAAAETAATHAQAVTDFNALFWDPATASYADWVDTAGKRRAYFYVDIPFTAIVAKVANASQAAALLQHYDTRLAEIERSLQVKAGNIWSPPGNLYPVADGDCVQNCAAFPSYENGGSFFHSVGLQVAALGAVGRADDATAVFGAFINSGFGVRCVLRRRNARRHAQAPANFPPSPFPHSQHRTCVGGRSSCTGAPTARTTRWCWGTPSTPRC